MAVCVRVCVSALLLFIKNLNYHSNVGKKFRSNLKFTVYNNRQCLVLQLGVLPVNYAIVLLIDAKWRKLPTCAEQVFMTPNHQPPSNVWKHFGLNTVDGKNMAKAEAACCLIKTALK